MNRSGVVLGRIRSVLSHPQADKLVVCEVELAKDKISSIVCGAPNAPTAAGRFVAVAAPGSKWRVPGDLSAATAQPVGEGTLVKIKKSKIRGVQSEGMICSLGELGFAPEKGRSDMDLNSGIWLIPDELVERDSLKLGEQIPDAWEKDLGVTHWEQSRKSFIDLETHWKEMRSLSQIGALLEWDQQVMMPQAGGQERTNQKALISRLYHEKSTEENYGKMLESEKSLGELRNRFENRSLELALNEFRKSRAVDEKSVMEVERLKSKCFELWLKAREKGNFQIVASALQDLIHISEEIARAKGNAVYGEGKKSSYEVLLEDFSMGLSSADLESIFSSFGNHLTPFVKSLEVEQKSVLVSTGKPFAKSDQINVAKTVMDEILGPELRSRIRLDESAHPFSIRIANGDARITSRYSETDLRPGLMGLVHESGHALYELQLPPWEHFPGSMALDIACHESQSLFWERSIGQSAAFARWIAPVIWDKFQFGERSLGLNKTKFESSVFKSLNQLSKTPIRVEADELHYPLHVKVRFELEKQLIDGTLRAKDLPEAWNTAYASSLGIEPKSDADGVLQDIHWYLGYYGYFPSYSIGAVVGWQLFDTLKKTIDVDHVIASGDWSPIRNWLKDNVHQFGRMDVGVGALCQRVTGSSLNPTGYANHLLEKYSKSK